MRIWDIGLEVEDLGDVGVVRERKWDEGGEKVDEREMDLKY